jgi:hypothetical protein
MQIGPYPAWLVAVAGTSIVAIGIIVGRLWRRAATKRIRQTRVSGGQVIATVGAVLVVATIGGYGFNRDDGSATIGFAVIGGALVVIGAMSGRLGAGIVRFGPTGAEIPIAESQVQSGHVIPVPRVTVEATLGGDGSASGDVAAPDKAPECLARKVPISHRRTLRPSWCRRTAPLCF